MIDLRYRMIMALSAADFGNPVCEQAAAICAEIAEQHCAQLHLTMTAPVIAFRGRDDDPACPCDVSRLGYHAQAMMTQTTEPLPPTVDIRRKDERFKTRLSWLDSKHS